ncbi:hypothetical protein Q9233_005110 [Columba guinea]|nr:hypothetical protein Q9233_005110 [Columba guinea]
MTSRCLYLVLQRIASMEGAALGRMMKSSVHSEEDDFVPELQRSIHPRERPDWEETLSAMARGADIPDIAGELPLRTCGSTASMKVKNVKKYINPGLMGCDAFHRLSFTKGHFPKMAECAHFHYENVDFGNIQPPSSWFLFQSRLHCFGAVNIHTVVLSFTFVKERDDMSRKIPEEPGSLPNPCDRLECDAI